MGEQLKFEDFVDKNFKPNIERIISLIERLSASKSELDSRMEQGKSTGVNKLKKSIDRLNRALSTESAIVEKSRDQYAGSVTTLEKYAQKVRSLMLLQKKYTVATKENIKNINDMSTAYIKAQKVENPATKKAMIEAMERLNKLHTETGEAASLAARKTAAADKAAADAGYSTVKAHKAAIAALKEENDAKGKNAGATKKAASETAEYAILIKKLREELKWLKIAEREQAKSKGFKRNAKETKIYHENLEDLRRQIKSTSSALKQAEKDQSNLNKKMKEGGKAAKSSTGFFTKFAMAFRTYNNISQLVGMLDGLIDIVKAYDKLAFTYKTIITDTYDLIAATGFLRDITEEFGVDLRVTSQQYIKFKAAADAANLATKDTNKIFKTVTKAGAVLGLTTDELRTTYLALEQMLSKGKVTTEELRRQLGERLPGAFNIMAKAVGVTTAELDEMLKKGEIISAEVLPKFEAALRKEYKLDVVTNIDTLQSVTTRLNTSWEIFVTTLLDSKGPIIRTFTDMTNGLAKFLKLTGIFIEDSDQYKSRIETESYAKYAGDFADAEDKANKLKRESLGLSSKQISIELERYEKSKKYFEGFAEAAKKKRDDYANSFNGEATNDDEYAKLMQLDADYKKAKKLSEANLKNLAKGRKEQLASRKVGEAEYTTWLEGETEKRTANYKERYEDELVNLDKMTKEQKADIDAQIAKIEEYNEHLTLEGVEKIQAKNIDKLKESYGDLAGAAMGFFSDTGIMDMSKKAAELFGKRQVYIKELKNMLYESSDQKGLVAALKEAGGLTEKIEPTPKDSKDGKPKDFKEKDLVGAYKRQKEELENILNLNTWIAGNEAQYAVNRERALLKLNTIQSEIIENEKQHTIDKDALWFKNEEKRAKTYLTHKKRTVEGTKAAQYELADIERELDEETIAAAKIAGIDLGDSKLNDTVTLSRLQFDYLDKISAATIDATDKQREKDLATATAVFNFKMKLLNREHAHIKSIADQSKDSSDTSSANEYNGNIPSGDASFWEKAGSLMTSYYRDAEDQDKAYQAESLQREVDKAQAQLDLYNSQVENNQTLFDQAKFDQLTGGLKKAQKDVAMFGISITEEFRAEVEAVGQAITDFNDALGGIFSALHEQRMAEIEEEQAALDKQYAKNTELAEGDADATKALAKQKVIDDEKIEKKRRVEKRKQAKIDKAQALVNIAIATSLAVMRAYSDAGPLAGTGFAIFVGALGAMQAAAIAMQPLPPLKKGRQDGPAGHFLVGDGGRREVIERKDGTTAITPDVDTPVYLNKGDKVWKSVGDYKRNVVRRSMPSMANTSVSKEDMRTALIEEAIARGFSRAQINNKNVINMPTVDINHLLWEANQINM